MKYTAADLSINFTVDWFFLLREEKTKNASQRHRHKITSFDFAKVSLENIVFLNIAHAMKNINR